MNHNPSMQKHKEPEQETPSKKLARLLRKAIEEMKKGNTWESLFE